MIGIVDYGLCNLGSVANALDYLGIPAEILDTPPARGQHTHLILPGVGAFGLAMRNLDARGWTVALREAVQQGTPLLGICLGMQLLFEEGEEYGTTTGLGLIPGRVVPLTPAAPCRVPHVGWNSLSHTRRHPIFLGVKEQVDVYFVHSFQCLPSRTADIVARCDHGGEFVSAAGQANVIGLQFHPEKSQDIGLKMLENFAGWDGTC